MALLTMNEIKINSDAATNRIENAQENLFQSTCETGLPTNNLAKPSTTAVVVSKEISTTDLQQHLQGMFALLQQQHFLKEAVKIESSHVGRMRYLAVVACAGQREPEEEETCILGFDCIGERTTLGLVLQIYADTFVTLDGDGGFSLCSGGSQHIFKPVSVHTMWAVLQTLHKACSRAQQYNHYPGGSSHRWAEYYEQRINSDRSCLNEWHLLPDVESRRPPSPDQLLKPRQKAETEKLIKSTLKEVMMVLDLDVVTSKDIRKRVEEELHLDLDSYKSFIDEEILTILGQMDGASRVFDDVYLGSEWNAANLEELQRNGVGHILNVTREIDNFFPGQFEYLNIRVYDDEATELLKHWDRTYKYITHAVKNGSKVLVHCKMGVSRSASVVIAYAMKAYDWDLSKALRHVKERRSCVKPNVNFMQQLEIYAGILDASRQRHNKLWRSKSETNLKLQTRNQITSTSPSPMSTSAAPRVQHTNEQSGSVPISPVQINANIMVDSVPADVSGSHQPVQDVIHLHGLDVPGDSSRPKSWSPEDSVAASLFPSPTVIQNKEEVPVCGDSILGNRAVCVSLRVPCGNGRTYSVSQNRAVQLESSPPPPLPTSPIGKEKFGSPCIVKVPSWKSEEYSLEKDSSGWENSDILECINPSFQDWAGNTAGSVPVPTVCNSLPRVGSVKDRICELETAAAAAVQPATPWRQNTSNLQDRPDRTGLVLNLASQFGTVTSTTMTSTPECDPMVVLAESSTGSTPSTDHSMFAWSSVTDSETPVVAQVKPAAVRHQAVLVRLQNDDKPKEDKQWSSSSSKIAKPVDPFSTHLDRVFDREERKQSNSQSSSQRESPLRQHSWGAGETRQNRLSQSNLLPNGKEVKEENGVWKSFSSYASEPHLQTLSGSRPNLQLISSAISLVQLPAEPNEPQSVAVLDNYSSSLPQVDIPPSGVVRMQREALESLQQKGPQYRRSLPDEDLKNEALPITYGRSVSEAPANSNRGSVVSRLRKELEAKAALPLTGSFAPSPLVVAAVAAAESAANKGGSSRASMVSLRKRSLSVDKMTYHTSGSKTGSTSESGSPSPPPVPRRPSCASINIAQDIADDDVSVKFLVDLFETSLPPATTISVGSERPRGFSESSIPNAAHCLTPSSLTHSSTLSGFPVTASTCRPSSVPLSVPVPQRQFSLSSPRIQCLSHSSDKHVSVVAKPPVPYDQPPIAVPRKTRKYHGKTHPLDHLASRQRHAHPVFGTM